jgi:predicted alpha/beta hydrolase
MHQERNDPVNKTRVQIDLLPGELERMNIVMRMTDLSTRKDLFNNALSLFEWAVTEVARGREIGSVTADGEITILTMPAFKSAANYGRRFAPYELANRTIALKSTLADTRGSAICGTCLANQFDVHVNFWPGRPMSHALVTGSSGTGKLAPSASLASTDLAVGVGLELAIPADDSTELAATLFDPTSPPSTDGALVIIAPAVGVRRSYYARFATYLAERGHPILIFDYRVIGGSRRGSLVGSNVRMRDWCILDVPGVIDWAQRTYPQRPIHWIGHSMGGFATGLARNGHLVSRQLNVATLSGYWGRMAAPEKWRVRLLMGTLGPLVVKAKGYFPGELMGGEDMPGPAYREWTAWCMKPGFLFDDETLRERRNFRDFRAPVRFMQFTDDSWGTPAAVGHMAEHFTASTDRSIWLVKPAEAGVKKIGHFGFFRPDVRDTLWKPAADWLLQ